MLRRSLRFTRASSRWAVQASCTRLCKPESQPSGHNSASSSPRCRSAKPWTYEQCVLSTRKSKRSQWRSNSNAFKLLKYYITQSPSRRTNISRVYLKCNNNIHILNFSTCSKRVNSAVLQPAKKLFSLSVSSRYVMLPMARTILSSCRALRDNFTCSPGSESSSPSESESESRRRPSELISTNAAAGGLTAYIRLHAAAGATVSSVLDTQRSSAKPRLRDRVSSSSRPRASKPSRPVATSSGAGHRSRGRSESARELLRRGRRDDAAPLPRSCDGEWLRCRGDREEERVRWRAPPSGESPGPGDDALLAGLTTVTTMWRELGTPKCSSAALNARWRAARSNELALRRDTPRSPSLPASDPRSASCSFAALLRSRRERRSSMETIDTTTRTIASAMPKTRQRPMKMIPTTMSEISSVSSIARRTQPQRGRYKSKTFDS